jgi:hypothetical protein
MGGNRKKNNEKKSNVFWQDGFLTGLFFGPEDGGNVFVRNVG